VIETRILSRTAATLGIQAVLIEIKGEADIPSAIATASSRSEALIVVTDPLMFVHRKTINAMATAARLPTLHGFREHVEAGGLISYGPNYLSMFHRAADIVDKILRGTKPSEIPVEQPTRFSLIINLLTAKAIGIEISPMMLVRADEVIE
jgi:putative ABC transport system substrate-binding protein